LVDSINIHALELRKGNQKAFKFVFELLYDALYNYALNFVKEEDAEELVQEAFLMIWDRRKMIDEDFNVKAYLYKSIHNQALNHIRHLKVVGQHVAEEVYLNSAIQRAKEPNPFLAKALNDYIELLPDRSKLIFKMSRVDGMRHKEIAQALSISEKTVEVQLRKARIFLKKILKRFYNEL
jgi:RNA polymerase sigma-70 factor (ECF subfamily)